MIRHPTPALSLLLLGAALAGSAGAQVNGTTGGSNSAPAGAPAFASEVKALVITRIATLPRAPSDRGDGMCDHLLKPPVSEAGRAVVAKGWQVTAEHRVGRYQAVSFIGRQEQGTSGSCLLGAGNIALFQGGALKAIIATSDDERPSVARIAPIEGGGLRIWDGDFLSQPVADLQVAADGAATIRPVAPRELVCKGKASVPNIYGMPIDKARTALRKAGWTPAPNTSAETVPGDSRAIDLAKQGLVEVEDCSGTGFGYCGFTYKGPADTGLSVTTVGDAAMPIVAGYGASCGAA